MLLYDFNLRGKEEKKNFYNKILRTMTMLDPIDVMKRKERKKHKFLAPICNSSHGYRPCLIHFQSEVVTRTTILSHFYKSIVLVGDSYQKLMFLQ